VGIISIMVAGGIYSSTGAVAIPTEAAHGFKMTRPKAVFTSEAQYEATKEACELSGIPLSKIYIMTSENGKHDIYNAETKKSLIRDTRLLWQEIKDPQVLKDTVVSILFTSGTTGFPKYILRSSRSNDKGRGKYSLQHRL
jgi:4-coumarate--CoA ligase